mmetsp:Transcript_30187/g.61446  ORF Transcript_30187/g.61446 Transcript_30187/m.61446 type:complete len:212 (-) Transcript_30187:1217-1852(-)
MRKEFYTSWREEAHWSSFHNAVVRLQSQLLQNMATSSTDDEESSISRPHRLANDIRMMEVGEMERWKLGVVDLKGSPDSESRDNCSDEMLSKIQDGPRNHKNSRDKPDRMSSQEEDLDSSSQLDYYDARLTHHVVDFVGFSADHETSINLGELASPLNVTSSSFPGDALVSDAMIPAEQELIELKLRLAMTESERDELEFELMQARDADDE